MGLGQVVEMYLGESEYRKVGRLSKNDLLDMADFSDRLIENRVKVEFQRVLSKKLYRVFNVVLNDLKISKNLVSMGRVVQNILENQDAGLQEVISVIQSDQNVNSNNVRNRTAEYIGENYTEEFLYVKIEEQLDVITLKVS